MSVGQIARAPVESGWSFFIPRRLDPALLEAEPPVRYELPRPEGPDFETLVRLNPGKGLAEQTRSLAAAAERALNLPKETAQAFASPSSNSLTFTRQRTIRRRGSKPCARRWPSSRRCSVRAASLNTETSSIGP